MILVRSTLALGLFAASFAGCRADPAPIVHYAPAQNLERIDVGLIAQAHSRIDMAAYVLTDWPIMIALNRAAERGVKVRLYLDRGNFGVRTPAPPLRALLVNPNVSVRIKRRGAPLMHLKSYQVDGRLLRTGAANFSASGLKKQDNDLIVIESKVAIAAFERQFETIFANGRPVSLGPGSGSDDVFIGWPPAGGDPPSNSAAPPVGGTGRAAGASFRRG